MPNVPAKTNGKVNPEYSRQYREENREHLREYGRKYYQENKEKIRENDRKNRLRYPERERARSHAQYYIPIGPNCELCESIENLERHHPDYSKPLEIITLCRKCHQELHQSIDL